jgi:hypothetical protein
MSHWAEVNENNIVLRVTVGNNDDPDEGYQWLVNNLGGTWLQTSYNTFGGVHYDPETVEPSADQSKALRKNYAGIGYRYDADLDAFIAGKPEPTDEVSDWVLNEETCLWEPVEA